ncbi:hypothetical protein J7L05_10245 [bacterium]|nr:hypothetical protein [bacterium]
MKLYSGIIVTFIILTLSLQSGMKFRPEFSLDISAQPGIEISNTGNGWLAALKSDSRFPYKIASISNTGSVIWERTFMYKTVAIIPDGGGALVLDEYGNFYRISRSGSIESNLMGIVEPGRNVIAKSNAGLNYASGGDNAITCFKSDGDIEWMLMLQQPVMNIFTIGNEIIISDRAGTLIKCDSESNELWRLEVGGFAPCNPEILINGNLVFGIRDSIGKQGKLIEITNDGEIVWETKLGYGVNHVYSVQDGFFSVGADYVTAFDSEGTIKWGQSFEGAKKLVPMGFNDDERLILGILNSDKDDDFLKITLLDWEGSISVVCKIPVKKNQFVNASRQGRLVLISERDETRVYKLQTMKEYLEELNAK